MDILNDIRKIALEKGAQLKEKKGVYTFDLTIAERKLFLFSKRTLKYISRFRILEEEKELKFTEMLKENSSGFSTGGNNDISPGFSFKKKSYSSSAGGMTGAIQEQSELFGKSFTYRFDYSEIRKTFERIAQKQGYTFKYMITSIGLQK